MAPLTDPDRLRAYLDALGNWAFSGYITFELPQTAGEWIGREFSGLTLKEIGRLMHEFVAGGGRVDEVRETRPEWSEKHEFHYDLRFKFQCQPVYVETRLRYRLPFAADESFIVV